MIKNAHSGLYIGIESNSSAQNADAKQYAENTQSTGQLFKIEITTSGYIKITPKSGENVNRVLALDGTSDTNPHDAKVQQRNFVDDTNRKDEWQLIPENDQASDTATLIPQHFRSLIQDDLANANDLYFTSDGFYMINKSLAEILGAKNITTVGDRSCSAFYDDWYMYAVKDSGSYVYGLLKMREHENDNAKDEDGNSTADDDAPGAAISFVAFDISKLTAYLDNNSSANSTALLNELKKVIDNAADQDYSQGLYNYFSNTNSVAPYLVAERYVEKVVDEDLTGSNELHYNSYIDEDDRIIGILEAIDESSESIQWNQETRTITIRNTSSLTYNEKRAILAVCCGSTNFNSFAAEVEFHADELVNYAKSHRAYKSSIVSDMTSSPDYNSLVEQVWLEMNMPEFPDTFYDKNGDMVVSQADAHGEW